MKKSTKLVIVVILIAVVGYLYLRHRASKRANDAGNGTQTTNDYSLKPDEASGSGRHVDPNLFEKKTDQVSGYLVFTDNLQR